MAEESERIQGILPYTYTYDQFTVFFYGDHVFVGGKEYPIGQCCVDVMNLDEAIPTKIAHRIKVCISAAVDLLTKKNRQRRLLCTGKAERCLGYHIYFAGLPGFEYGQGGQLSHLPTAYG